VRSAVEGMCDAPLDIEDRQSGRMSARSATVNRAAARKAHKTLGRDEAMEKLNVMHESQPVRVDAMEIVRSMFDALESLYGRGHRMDVYTIAMIAGVCTAYDALGRPEVFSTPAAMGGG